MYCSVVGSGDAGGGQECWRLTGKGRLKIGDWRLETGDWRLETG